MKPLVYIWILGLLVTGFVAVLFPSEDTNIYPTEYKTVVQPVSVPAPAQPVDVSVVQRVAVQADALAVSVQRAEDKAEAIAGRLQTIEDGQTKLADAAKALRVYVDEQVATKENKQKPAPWWEWLGLSVVFLIVGAMMFLQISRDIRERRQRYTGGPNAARKDH